MKVKNEGGKPYLTKAIADVALNQMMDTAEKHFGQWGYQVEFKPHIKNGYSLLIDMEKKSLLVGGAASKINDVLNPPVEKPGWQDPKPFTMSPPIGGGLDGPLGSESLKFKNSDWGRQCDYATRIRLNKFILEMRARNRLPEFLEVQTRVFYVDKMPFYTDEEGKVHTYTGMTIDLTTDKEGKLVPTYVMGPVVKLPDGSGYEQTALHTIEWTVIRNPAHISDKDLFDWEILYGKDFANAINALPPSVTEQLQRDNFYRPDIFKTDPKGNPENYYDPSALRLPDPFTGESTSGAGKTGCNQIKLEPMFKNYEKWKNTPWENYLNPNIRPHKPYKKTGCLSRDNREVASRGISNPEGRPLLRPDTNFSVDSAKMKALTDSESQRVG
jgi:hypothetical protein